MGAPGVVGTLVMGGGVRQVAFDGDGAVAGYELDGASEVARWAGKDLALAGSTPGTLQAAFDLFPGAAKETLLLEIFLEHTDGEVADFLGQVAGELALQFLFETFEVVGEILDCHLFVNLQRNLML